MCMWMRAQREFLLTTDRLCDMQRRRFNVHRESLCSYKQKAYLLFTKMPSNYICETRQISIKGGSGYMSIDREASW